MRAVLFILIILAGDFFCYAQPQQPVKNMRQTKQSVHSRFAGKYELNNGMSVQFAVQENKIVLIVPGAPIQELDLVGKNKFKSKLFKEAEYEFVEDNGKVSEVVITEQRGSARGKKIGDDTEVLSMVMDSLLLLRKSTAHFLLLYSPADAIVADSIAVKMEKDYQRILADFRLSNLPKITVRIYPDLLSFHKGINFPAAPDQVLATAFGKRDIRMVSPNNAGPESWMLAFAAPHELTHVVHLNIDYAPNNPTWLWEGVAQYEAKWFFNPNEIEAIRKREFPPFDSLNNGIEYMMGYAIIEAIKNNWGFNMVLRLIKNRGDVQKAANMNQKLFEQKVYEYIYKTYVKN